MAGLVPELLTSWHSTGPPWWIGTPGAILIVGGIVVLIHAFLQFALDGHGTPAPIAPTKRLIISGAHRHVRNPMYLAVLTIIAGEALLLGRPVLLAYAAAFWLVVATFVTFYEEPTLLEQYGDEYEAYRRAVRAWRPNLRPYDGSGTDT
jgi:protein-S-isoprenylcysteine O-methyltransferase Ste14